MHDYPEVGWSGNAALRVGDGLICEDAYGVREAVSELFSFTGDEAVPDLLCGQLT